MKLFNFFNMISLCFLCGCSSVVIPTTTFQPGEIVHSFKDGKIQILTEISPDGKIVALLKALKSNTSIESIKIDNAQRTVSFTMLVKDEKNTEFASWTDAEPITLVLDPKPVSEISLSGKVVQSAGNITILIPDN